MFACWWPCQIHGCKQQRQWRDFHSLVPYSQLSSQGSGGNIQRGSLVAVGSTIGMPRMFQSERQLGTLATTSTSNCCRRSLRAQDVFFTGHLMTLWYPFWVNYGNIRWCHPQTYSFWMFLVRISLSITSIQLDELWGIMAFTQEIPGSTRWNVWDLRWSFRQLEIQLILIMKPKAQDLEAKGPSCFDTWKLEKMKSCRMLHVMICCLWILLAWTSKQFYFGPLHSMP